jgi:uncharacterized protein (TIGR03663 family)
LTTKTKLRSHPFKAKENKEEVAQVIQVEAVENSPTPLAWLTVEVLLYGLIIVAALGLRLWGIGSTPLSNSEAAQSLAAWAVYHGHQPAAILYSPLLLSLNSLTFFLFGASDASARLAALLLGMFLVILPATLRRQLGPPVALLASFLLAISPTAIFLARTVNSEVAVAVGALMIVAGFFNWVDGKQQLWLWLAAGGLAVLLTGGPMAYSILLVFTLIVLIKLPAFKVLVAGTTAGSKADSTVAVSDEVEDQPNGLGQAGIFLAVMLVLLATTFTLNMSGFGMLPGLLTDWLSRFGFQAQPQAGFNAVFLLTIYEPLLVLAGLTGLAYVLLRRDLLGLLLALWFVGLLLLDLVMGGRPNGNIILLVVPLAFLAAIALADLLAAVRRWGSWANEGMLLGAGLVIMAFGYIGLTGWLLRSCGPDDRLCQYSWLQPVAALVLFLVIVAFFAYLNDIGSALRGAALTAVAVALLATVNIGWRLNYGPLMNLGYQPLAGIPASTGLVQLTQTLAGQSVARVGDARLLDISLAGVDSPALQWQLRDFSQLKQANSLPANTAATAIITPASATNGLDLAQAYLGHDLPLDAVWSPVGLPFKDFVKWLIYRQVEERPQGNKVILWLRVGEN